MRTLERWLAAYRLNGEAGLVDTRTIRGRDSGVDHRWYDAVRVVLAGKVSASTPTRSATPPPSAAPRSSCSPRVRGDISGLRGRVVHRCKLPAGMPVCFCQKASPSV
jgi:hypothetical protein